MNRRVPATQALEAKEGVGENRLRGTDAMPKPRMTKPLKAGAKNRGVSKPVPQGGKSKSQKAGRKKAPTRSLEDDKARFKQINERLRALDTTRTKAERERERAERECQDAQKEQAKLQKELEKLTKEGSAGAGKKRIGEGSAGAGRKVIKEGSHSAGTGKKKTNGGADAALLKVSKLHCHRRQPLM